jgi:hypothetical protein
MCGKKVKSPKHSEHGQLIGKKSIYKVERIVRFQAAPRLLLWQMEKSMLTNFPDEPIGIILAVMFRLHLVAKMFVSAKNNSTVQNTTNKTPMFSGGLGLNSRTRGRAWQHGIASGLFMANSSDKPAHESICLCPNNNLCTKSCSALNLRA